jgi:hypothetical protein
VVTAVIEIPTNERNKYELDKKLGVFRPARRFRPILVHANTAMASSGLASAGPRQREKIADAPGGEPIVVSAHRTTQDLLSSPSGRANAG